MQKRRESLLHVVLCHGKHQSATVGQRKGFGTEAMTQSTCALSVESIRQKNVCLLVELKKVDGMTDWPSDASFTVSTVP